MKKFTILVALALVASLLIFYGGQTATADHPSGPAAYWPLDEGSGATAADSAHTNDGALSGGKFGNALEFDGGAYVTAPRDGMDPEVGTFEMWVRPDDLAVTPQAFIVVDTNGDAADNYQMQYWTDGKLYFRVNDLGQEVSKDAGTAGFTEGAWHHLAMSWDSSGVSAFVDGSLVGTYAGTMSFPNALDGDAYVGSWYTASRNFIGRIDEVRISNIARTSFDLTSPPSDDLYTVALWHFDESVGTDVFDASSSSGNDGTIVGATWAGPVWTSSLSFDGVDDYVRVDDTDDDELDIADELSINAWVKKDGSSYKSILNKGTARAPGRAINYGLHVTGADKLRFVVWYPSLCSGYCYHTSTDSLPIDGAFHHVAVTVDAATGTVEFFIDGENAGEVTNILIPTSLPVSSEPLEIGRQRRADLTPEDVQYWDGMIEELQIYARVLSEAEVRSVALTGATGTLYVDDDGEVGRGSVNCDGAGFAVYDVIQDAVDAAEFGDTVLACTGTFSESVVFGSEDSGITLSAAPSASPVLDGTFFVGSATSVFGITLLDGVTGGDY